VKSEKGQVTAAAVHLSEDREAGYPKNKSGVVGVIQSFMKRLNVDASQPVLVVGGGQEDLDILSACGFQKIVMSNLGSTELSLDAEDIALPDNSYPLVFAHAVLHHCRCPQRAVGEMLRVAQKHVFFVEPNDSLALRTLVRLGFSFPYELAAVADHEYASGGMRNGAIPNYIYRWTGREVEKSVAAYHPERQCRVYPHAYWDFYVNENDLLVRKETLVPKLAGLIGTRNFIAGLRLMQSILNVLPPLRSQGNKFFCAIQKDRLQPWIDIQDGQPVLKKEAGASQ
jgi:SAM-dependent methyltransferase